MLPTRDKSSKRSPLRRSAHTRPHKHMQLNGSELCIKGNSHRGENGAEAQLREANERAARGKGPSLAARLQPTAGIARRRRLLSPRSLSVLPVHPPAPLPEAPRLPLRLQGDGPHPSLGDQPVAAAQRSRCFPRCFPVAGVFAGSERETILKRVALPPLRPLRTHGKQRKKLRSSAAHAGAVRPTVAAGRARQRPGPGAAGPVRVPVPPMP